MANVLSIVTYRIFPPKTGGQKCIASFNEFLSAEHDLFCYTVKENDPSAAAYTVYNEMQPGKLRYVNLLAAKRIGLIIRRHKISHVVIDHPYYGWMGLLLRKLYNVKLIIRSHNIESERFRSMGKWWWKLMRNYERWIHRNADYTFAITEEDCRYFTESYGVRLSKLSVITYGFPIQATPTTTERAQARDKLLQQYKLAADTVLYLFNGALDYAPNTRAVEAIVSHINPIVKKTLPYRIIICGSNLPEEIKKLPGFTDLHIIHAGFVEDISMYLKGSDVFINPVLEGGGIKTKLVEALGYNMNAVSSQSGAFGVDPRLCNGKLLLCADGEWQAFASAMLQASLHETADTPPAFFQHFYWGNVARKAADIIRRL